MTDSFSILLGLAAFALILGFIIGVRVRHSGCAEEEPQKPVQKSSVDKHRA